MASTEILPNMRPEFSPTELRAFVVKLYASITICAVSLAFFVMVVLARPPSILHICQYLEANDDPNYELFKRDV